MKVLLVDDDEKWTCIAMNMIGDVARRIYTATTMAEAKERISQPNHFDVVILDLALPDSAPRETIETIPWILKSGRRAVIVSGFVNDELRALAQSKGAADCLFKGSTQFARELRACLA